MIDYTMRFLEKAGSFYEFKILSGWVSNAAGELLALANVNQETSVCVFNGVLLVAKPGQDLDSVINNWMEKRKVYEK